MKPTTLALLSLAALPIALGAYVSQTGAPAPRTITVTARVRAARGQQPAQQPPRGLEVVGLLRDRGESQRGRAVGAVPARQRAPTTSALSSCAAAGAAMAAASRGRATSRLGSGIGLL
jgi:hypothetical protein